MWQTLDSIQILSLSNQNHSLTKVCLFLDLSCTILSSLEIVVIFNNTSAEFVLISANVWSKMTTILKELRIGLLQSKNKRTLVRLWFWFLSDSIWIESRVWDTFGCIKGTIYYKLLLTMVWEPRGAHLHFQVSIFLSKHAS